MDRSGSPSARLAVLRQLGMNRALAAPVFDRLAEAAQLALGARTARISLAGGAGDALLGAAGSAELAGSPEAALDAPLVLGDGEEAGVLSVLDDRPRQWSDAERDTLRALAAAAAESLEAAVERELLRTAGETSLVATERKQAERVVHDAAVSYRSLFDSLEELVCIVDLDGSLLSVNEAVLQRHGYARHEILGGTPAQLTAPEWGDPRTMIERMRADPPPPPMRVEWCGRTKAGETFPMEVVLTRGHYFGAPVVIAVGRDVTERKAAEAALRASEEQFRQIAENIREDFWIYDAHFERTIYVSPAHEDVWGLSTELARSESRSFLSRVHPEDLPALLEAMRELSVHGEVVRIEYRILHDDGSVRWVWSRGFPVFDSSGKVYRVVGTTEDVTDRKEAEQALRWLGTVVDSSADAIVSCSLDGETTSWNPAAERIFGYTAEEMIGRNWSSLVPADQLDAYRAVMSAIRQGRTPEPYEGQRLRKDGKRIDVSAAPFPLHDAAGRVVGAAAILRDVTEPKAREEQRRLLAAALERLEEGVTLATFDGEIIYANENHGRLLGYDPELRPRPPYTAFLPDEEAAEEQRRFFRTVMEEGGCTARVRRRRLDDGRIIPVELIMARIDREGGGPSLLFGIVRDVSAEIERERYLRRAERLASVGTLVGGVAHELNNPLHAVRNFAEIMLMEERSGEDREALEIMKREADRAAKIVSDLRLFARQTQDERSERVAVDLNDVVRHVTRVRRYSLETRNVSVVEELEAELPPVLANRGELEQVVLNLIVNAEQAMARSQRARRLKLSTATGAAGVVLRISDTGEGIAPENRDRIFDPFFTTKSPGEGTGLGLSVVHSIVSEHGGQIRVESDARKGTTFVVDLPAAGPADRVVAEEAERFTGPRGEVRVLVVEDEDSVRRATVRYLNRAGYRADGAADGREALGLIDAGHYDAIVADLRMPGLDGEALLRELRKRGGGLDRRLIFITGDASGVRGAPFLARASVPVLLKPVRLEEVAQQIARLTGSGRTAARVVRR